MGVNLSDIRGLNRLAIDATTEITDLVEAVHYLATAPPGLLGPIAPGRTGGITGLMYHSIRKSYQLVGAGTDAILERMIPMFGEPPSTRQREARLAVLNGVWGDYLAATHNPLAIDMSLRHGGTSLNLEKPALQAAMPGAGHRLLVMVHGLCMSDLGWLREGHDHGAALARDLGHTPVYLHYNSGLHISINGRRFADLLEALVQAWPEPVEELVIVGHSMGGLVSRSACYYGTLAGYSWPRRLQKLILLASPHHGSPLERLGNLAGLILGVTPYTAPLQRLGMKRSAGITDLRYGNLLDEDWAGRDRFAHAPDQRRFVPLPEGVQCYAMAASRGSRPGDLRDRLIGDGAVTLDSALGRHENPDQCLAFPESRQWIGFNMSHTDLLHRPDVYEKIKQWLTA